MSARGSKVHSRAVFRRLSWKKMVFVWLLLDEIWYQRGYTRNQIMIQFRASCHCRVAHRVIASTMFISFITDVALMHLYIICIVCIYFLNADVDEAAHLSQPNGSGCQITTNKGETSEKKIGSSEKLLKWKISFCYFFSRLSCVINFWDARESPHKCGSSICRLAFSKQISWYRVLMWLHAVSAFAWYCAPSTLCSTIEDDAFNFLLISRHSTQTHSF